MKYMCLSFLYFVFEIVFAETKFHVISTTRGPDNAQSDHTFEFRTCSAVRENNELLLQNGEQSIQNRKIVERRLKNIDESLSNYENYLQDTKRQIIQKLFDQHKDNLLSQNLTGEIIAVLQRKINLCELNMISLKMDILKDQVEKVTKPIQEQLKKTAEQLEKELENISQNIIGKIEKSVQDTYKQINAGIERMESKKSKSIFFPRNCQEVLKGGKIISGVYSIWPASPEEGFLVRCNMDTRGGGWVYVLNRFDGSENFYLNWRDYKKGFGNLLGEFWLGLDLLHKLTGFEHNELLVEVVDWDNKQVSSLYDSFQIGSETEGYAIIELGKYSGDGGDSLRTHVGMKFSTKDRDQDIHPQTSCSVSHHGAWWFTNCYYSHLLGTYLKEPTARSSNNQGIIWSGHHGWNYSHSKVRMMIRPLYREID